MKSSATYTTTPNYWKAISDMEFIRISAQEGQQGLYYQIEYRDSNGDICMGYGSYNLAQVMRYKVEYFGGDGNAFD